LLLRRRLAELATCELLLFENYPGWALVMPFYLLSYIADNPALPLRPFRRIVRSIRAAISQSFGVRLLAVRPFETLRLYCDLDAIYHVAGEYMRGETVHLLSPKDQVVLDLGAHYGLVSTKMAASLSISSLVIAVEAHPSNYTVLKRNLELNHLTNVRALNFAVAPHAGFTTISNTDGISTHYTLAKRSEKSAPASRVPCYRLSDILELLDVDQVDLVKMDIEGLELEVVQSSFPALASRILKLDIEVHQFDDVAPLLNILRSNGYMVWAKRAGILSRSYRILAEKGPTRTSKSDTEFKNRGLKLTAGERPLRSRSETKVTYPA
jgi:FkbM family methyltransferase